jgi:hypothetical protein
MLKHNLRLDWRDFMLAKDPEFPEQNQDVWRIDAQRGIAAIADGVALGLFCRQWARLLTDAAVEAPPDPEDAAGMAGWLARQRETWGRSIDTSRLAWYQRPKLREGAFSTLLWIRIFPQETSPADSAAEVCGGRLCGHAIGDGCLFLVRDGTVVRRFPIESAAQLDNPPLALGSVDLGRDGLLRFDHLEETCYPGDLIVLCTDALAQWGLRQEESGQPPQWEDYWNMPEEAWENEILALRADRSIRRDDTTLLLIRVGG